MGMQFIRSVINAMDRQTVGGSEERTQDPNGRNKGFFFLQLSVDRRASGHKPADRLSDTQTGDREGVENKTCVHQYSL